MMINDYNKHVASKPQILKIVNTFAITLAELKQPATNELLS